MFEIFNIQWSTLFTGPVDVVIFLIIFAVTACKGFIILFAVSMIFIMGIFLLGKIKGLPDGLSPIQIMDMLSDRDLMARRRRAAFKVIKGGLSRLQ